MRLNIFVAKSINSVSRSRKSSLVQPVLSEKSNWTEQSSDYSEYISTKENISRRGLKLLTSKKILQGLPTVLAQVQAGKTSENFLNEICQIMYSLYQVKEITKEIYNNITNSVKL